MYICIHRMCTEQPPTIVIYHRLGSAHTGADIRLCNNGNYNVELQTTVAICYSGNLSLWIVQP